jgi:acetolactate synthase-1/2/3 large subunit
MTRPNGGALLAETLARLGVKHVFALHGGHLDAFLVACPDVGIRLIDMRHEATAGHAADAYARATGGSIGVAVITAGPGFTNALTPMTSAYVDAIPVLFIAGSPPLREAETNPLQGGFDQIAMAAPVTKWAHRITNAERIPDIIEKGFRIATSGRPGPVFLDIPIDVMFMPAKTVMLPIERAPVAFDRPVPSPDTITRLLKLLREAKRPVIIAGGGTILSPTAAPLRTFVEASGIPVATNAMAHGVLPADHPMYVGGVGAIGATAARQKLAPDLIVLAGARAGMNTGGRSGAVIPHAAKVVQIDIDGGEIGRLRPVEMAIVADCAGTFRALAEAAPRQQWADYRNWTETLQSNRVPFAAAFEDAPKETRPGVLHPYHAAKAAMAALDPDTAIVVDGGESSGWCQQHVRSAGPGLFMTNGYLGCLGISQGFAIGTATAQPDRNVAVFTGDGAVGFHIQEFDTMVRHKLPITTIVMNNSCWAISRRGQDIVFGENRRSIVALADTNYDQVAIAFGGRGERVDRYEDIAPAIRRAQLSKQPTCINLIIDAEVVNPSIPAMVGDPNAKDEILIPYYENIPIER